MSAGAGAGATGAGAGAAGAGAGAAGGGAAPGAPGATSCAKVVNADSTIAEHIPTDNALRESARTELASPLNRNSI